MKLNRRLDKLINATKCVHNELAYLQEERIKLAYTLQNYAEREMRIINRELKNAKRNKS